ncbi:hypothetical protein Tco_0130106 [Tanacetum coccineum]
MVIYNALPRKEYERIFMCNTAKEIWKTLLITHQGNSQVKDNKIDLFVQQYKQFVISKEKVERKSLALKAKKESSDEECSTSGSEDGGKRLQEILKEKRCGDPNHLIGEFPKTPKDKNQIAFVGGSWSDSGDEDDEKVKDKTCLVAHALIQVRDVWH